MQNRKPMPKKRKYAESSSSCLHGPHEFSVDGSVIARDGLEEEVQVAAKEAKVKIDALQRRHLLRESSQDDDEDDAEWSMYVKRIGKNNKNRRQLAASLHHGGEEEACAFCRGWAGVKKCPFHDEEERGRMRFVGDMEEGVKLMQEEEEERISAEEAWNHWFYEGCNLDV